MRNPFRKKYRHGTDPDRRVGPADRRKKQANPIVQDPGKGWSVGPKEVYKRTDELGKETLSPDQRMGPKDRRKKHQ